MHMMQQCFQVSASEAAKLEATWQGFCNCVAHSVLSDGHSILAHIPPSGWQKQSIALSVYAVQLALNLAWPPILKKINLL